MTDTRGPFVETGTTPSRRALRTILDVPGTRTLTVAMSKDPNAKVSILVVPPGRQEPQLAVKIPTTSTAADAVEKEARVLVELRRMGLGPIHRTIPRFVQVCEHEGRTVLVASALPGVPMARIYNSWPHTAHQATVAADFRAAQDWLARFQAASTSSSEPVSLLAGTAERVREVGAGGSAAERRAGLRAGRRIEAVHRLLSSFTTPRTAGHGDFWFGNLLVDHPGTGAVTGVVDWECATTRGEPLRDLGRFAISYSTYLDRHTRVGHRVAGHPHLRAEHDCTGIVYALTGSGWYPRLVHTFLATGLLRLGLPEELWYAVGWAAVADVVATADDAGFARRHIALLDVLPQPRIPGVRR